MSNSKRRLNFTGQDKVTTLRQHLVEKVSVSHLCGETVNGVDGYGRTTIEK